MRLDIIISALFIIGYAYNSELEISIDTGYEDICLTDIIYGKITNEELNNLIVRRKIVRKLVGNKAYRMNQKILDVPVVFHNLYKNNASGNPENSYCDYGNDNIVNDPDICNDRMLSSLNVLNAQYLSAGLRFILHPDYLEMLHDTIPGFDGFYEDATNGNSTDPSPNTIKKIYNIPNAVNIYTHKCLPGSETSCVAGKLGFSTYPWSLDDNEPGVFIKNQSLIGSTEVYSSSQVGVLAHEIGHFFSLLHINGTWFLKNTNTPREMVSGIDCEIYGDLICDTPGTPGYAPLGSDPDSLQSWYLNSDLRECIFHGYGGNYNPESEILQIGGHNIAYDQGTYPNYNYCEQWGFEDPYGIEENCGLFTNYDNQGNFFGTRDIREECLNEDKSYYATAECNINEYLYLPIGNNFMQSGTVILYNCSPRPSWHDDFDDSNHGFSNEQFDNIRYSLEHDYTGCNIPTACNYDSLFYMIAYDETLCKYPCSTNNGCLSTDLAYNTNHNLYNCNGICFDDIDEDNICDEMEIVGCQDQDACNYNEFATDPNTCEYPDEFYDCNGSCLNDINDDGVCDENMSDCFSITGIYPNPFNPITTIRYGLCQGTDVQISIYDINGRLITILINEFQRDLGYRTITWDASNTASGIYLIEMITEHITSSHKIVLIK